jgi:hypothetical protein
VVVDENAMSGADVDVEVVTGAGGRSITVDTFEANNPLEPSVVLASVGLTGRVGTADPPLRTLNSSPDPCTEKERKGKRKHV